MRAFSALFFSFVTSALAYQVIQPSGTKGWSDSGSQNLTWARADLDPPTFTVVLTSDDHTVDQVLAAQVDGSLGTVLLNPPSGGWPTGQSFRIGLVQDPNHLDILLAQSSDFEIGNPSTSAQITSTPLSSSTLSAVAFSSPTVTPPSTNAAATASSTTNSGLNPVQSNAGFRIRISAAPIIIFTCACFFGLA